ncbi:MAG: cadherin-like beta sandwich domain-containing protein [Clostridium sp.]|nr:cadherin-like beta sandwich domain-containing protein [Clostridium sp.]
MKKTWKRFVSLLVVFASIMSFMPIQFGYNGQAANAAPTDIIVSGTATQSGDKITMVNGEYATNQPYSNFQIAVPIEIVNESDIKIGSKGVLEQEVIITSINKIKLDGLTLDEKNAKLADIGVHISQGDVLYNSTKTIGVSIDGLPFGINRIEYRVREKTSTNKGQYIDANDPSKGMVDYYVQDEAYYPSTQTSSELVIQHANKFVQKKINPMIFNSYIGSKDVYDANNQNGNVDMSNRVPFLFTEEAPYNEKLPLRYIFDIADDVTTLQYEMQFDNVVPISNNTKIYKNGALDTTVTVANHKVTGYLKELGGSDLIVVKLDSNDPTAVSKAYSIELQYNTLASDDDYTLRESNITKFNYDKDESVKAYVGKKFNKVDESDDFITYKGEITIDKKAGMISLDPRIGRDASKTAFKISNHYDGSNIQNSRMINGKQFVDFNKGTDNELWIQVYEGKDGNVTGKQLAVYKLKVNIIGSDDSTVDFNFANAVITQPGRNPSTNALEFNPDRRTYDLYCDDDSVHVELLAPSTTDQNGNRREYIKAWGGTSVQSDTTREITDIAKDSGIDITIGDYKKIIIQAYYDQEVLDDNGNVTGTEATPIGQKYTFYIAKNADQPDNDNGNTVDNNASLSNIKVKGYTIESKDGTTGFSSDNYTYETTVKKDDESAKVTVTTESDEVKDITVTVVETGDEYGMESDIPFEFPLNKSGKTTLSIVVTAADKVTSKTYTLTINNDTKSANALLKNIVTNTGDFTFDPDKKKTKIRVDQNTKKISITPIPEDANAKVTVDGEKYTGSPITISLTGSQETDVDVKVTSEDGTASNTYSLEIIRTSEDLDDDDDEDEDDIFYDEYDDCWVDTSKYEEWGKIKNRDVYFDKKGRQVKDSWINTNNTWYYLDSKGYKATGWRKDTANKTYYLDPVTGAVRTGWLNQNGKWYYLGLNGVMQTKWLYLNKNWYYFSPEGEMMTNETMYIDGQMYNFGPDGAIY